jgi:hypothetical protein
MNTAQRQDNPFLATSTISPVADNQTDIESVGLVSGTWINQVAPQPAALK